jgi:hypothetical protein
MTSRVIRIIVPLFERLEQHGRARRRRQYKERLARYTARWFARMPKARVFPDTTTTTTISTQPQALFFSKLPPEVRGLIYSYALCDDSGELELQVAKDIVGERHEKPFVLSCPGAQQLLGFPSSCKLSYVQVYTT